jgi:hypothetical protein
VVPVEEVLALWREAERARETLPEGHPERTAVERDIAELRAMYVRLTDGIEQSERQLQISHRQVARANALLGRIRSALGVDEAVLPGVSASGADGE